MRWEPGNGVLLVGHGRRHRYEIIKEMGQHVWMVNDTGIGIVGGRCPSLNEAKAEVEEHDRQDDPAMMGIPSASVGSLPDAKETGDEIRWQFDIDIGRGHMARIAANAHEVFGICGNVSASRRLFKHDENATPEPLAIAALVCELQDRAGVNAGVVHKLPNWMIKRLESIRDLLGEDRKTPEAVQACRELTILLHETTAGTILMPKMRFVDGLIEVCGTVIGHTNLGDDGRLILIFDPVKLGSYEFELLAHSFFKRKRPPEQEEGIAPPESASNMGDSDTNGEQP